MTTEQSTTMKAKHFKKLRSQVQYYLVECSPELFGGWYGWSEYRIRGEVVLARNAQEAIKRLHRRNHEYTSGNYYQTNHEWSKWRVRPANKPKRFETHWK